MKTALENKPDLSFEGLPSEKDPLTSEEEVELEHLEQLSPRSLSSNAQKVNSNFDSNLKLTEDNHDGQDWKPLEHQRQH